MIYFCMLSQTQFCYKLVLESSLPVIFLECKSLWCPCSQFISLTSLYPVVVQAKRTVVTECGYILLTVKVIINHSWLCFTWNSCDFPDWSSSGKWPIVALLVHVSVLLCDETIFNLCKMMPSIYRIINKIPVCQHLPIMLIWSAHRWGVLCMELTYIAPSPHVTGLYNNPPQANSKELAIFSTH